QRGRLAGAVRAGNGHQLTRPDRQRHGAKLRLTRPQPDGRVLELEHRRDAHVALRAALRRSSTANSGTPITAVTTPTRSSRGANRAPAAASATTTKQPPSANALGSRPR